MKKRLFLIDAMAMAFRSFYAFGMKQLTNSAGQPTSAVFGSAQFMLKLIAEQKPDYLVIALDSDEPTFRHKMFEAYKANRSDMPEELAVQMGDFLRLMRSFGCPVVLDPGVEADDLIGTLAKRHAGPDLDVYIVSGDKDFMQLVSDHVFCLQPKKGDEALLIDRKGVFEKFGVAPEQVIDCLAIIGDTADNVPGVHGIGDKGAAKLVSEYGSLEGIYANLEKITNKRQKEALIASRESVFLSRELVTIKCDCAIDLTLDEMRCDVEQATANDELLALFKQMEFRGLVSRTEAAIKAREAASRAQSCPDEPVRVEMARSFDDYHLVADEAALQQLLARIERAEAFAFDTETTGLDVVASEPVGASFSFEKGKAYYLPFVARHLQGLAPGDVLARLKPALERSPALKIAHNLKFDLQMLRNAGIEPAGPFRDTMIMDWLVDSTGRQHGLDACCLRYLEYEKIKTETLIGKDGQIPIVDADLTELTRYACEDADLTLRLHDCLVPHVERHELMRVLTDVEMPLVPVLARMEQAGIYIDVDVLMEFSGRLATMAADLEAKIYELAGTQFNINSTRQLADLLFTQLKVHEQVGVRNLKKTKSGYSTDESVLSRLAEHPLPRAILEYRGITKLKGTYVDTLPQLVNPRTGRVHTSFHQTGTATGRLSSSDPNLQNIPIRTELGQEIRKAFRPQDPANVIVSADYSQIELRLLAHLADEKALQQAYAEGQDIHRLTASKILGVPMDQVDPETRSRAKAINFGIIYGMGPRRLAQETGVTVKEASEFIERYFAGYPGIDRYIKEAIAFARERGESRTVTGRRRPITGMEAANQRDAVSAENIAVNSPIQGAAADLIKIAMVRIDRALRERKLRSRMLLQVHDELVFEVPAAEAEEAKAIIGDCMRHAMDLKVPLDVQIDQGSNWLEAH